MNRIASLALLALGACTTVVTDDDGEWMEPGDLEFTWRVGTSDCVEAGVNAVAVFLDGEEAGVYACDDGVGVIERLEPGSYVARLIGRDANGWARYDAVLGDVVVDSGVATAVPTAVLGALPGDIYVTWYFDNGRMCAANGVEEVEVTLFDDEYVVDAQTVPCDDGILMFQAMRAGEYQVNVMGRDLDGQALYNGVGAVQLQKGDQIDLEVMLEAL